MIGEIHDALVNRAENHVAFAHALTATDGSWGSTTFPLAGGHAVWWGAGMYLNAGQACGHLEPMTDSEFERLEETAAQTGVLASIESSPATHPATIERAAARGYSDDGAISVLRRPTNQPIYAINASAQFVIEAAREQVETWQTTSALGWEHHSAEARRANDAISIAAAIVDGDGLVIARDSSDGRPVACASVTINGAYATLGGMSTVPSERGRGLQSALLTHRLNVAREAGCATAISTTQHDSASERNLMRHGFKRWFTLTNLVRTA